MANGADSNHYILQIHSLLNELNGTEDYTLIFKERPNSIEYLTDGEGRRAIGLRYSINEMISMEFYPVFSETKKGDAISSFNAHTKFLRWDETIKKANPLPHWLCNGRTARLHVSHGKNICSVSIRDIENVIRMKVSKQFELLKLCPKIQAILKKKIMCRYDLYSSFYDYLYTNNLLLEDGTILNRGSIGSILHNQSPQIVTQGFFFSCVDDHVSKYSELVKFYNHGV